MFEITHFDRYHLRQMPVEQSRWLQSIGVLERCDYSWTVLEDDQPIASAGVILQWKGRACVWAVMPDRGQLLKNAALLRFCTRNGLALFDRIQENPDYRRLETTVYEPFSQAHRWVKMLGFKSEGLMRRYDPAGRDHRLWSRIRPP